MDAPIAIGVTIGAIVAMGDMGDTGAPRGIQWDTSTDTVRAWRSRPLEVFV